MSEAVDLSAVTSTPLGRLLVPAPRTPLETPLAEVLPYNIEISDWQSKPIQHEEGLGYFETSMVYLTDGSRYVFRKILAENPISDISADFMPPLATRTKGFNKYIGRKAAAAGIHNRLVGTNQGHKYTLEHDAQAFLHMLNHDDTVNADVRPGTSLELGYSMGAMKGLGAFTLANVMGRDHLGILIDPCMAEPIDYSKEKLGEVLPYLGREVKQTARILLGDAGKSSILQRAIRSRHLMSTVSASPAFLRNMHDKWRVIATGETGTFPPKIPLDAAIVIHFFNDSRYNHQNRYRELFANHRNVHIVEDEGLHLTGGRREYVAEIVIHAQSALLLLEEGIDKRDVADTLAKPIKI